MNNNLLKSCTGNLASLLATAKNINQINQNLRNNNEVLFNEDISLSIIKEKTAVFVVSNSALSFRLKQQQTAVINELHKLDLEINDIQIKVKGF